MNSNELYITSPFSSEPFTKVFVVSKNKNTIRVKFCEQSHNLNTRTFTRRADGRFLEIGERNPYAKFHPRIEFNKEKAEQANANFYKRRALEKAYSTAVNNLLDKYNAIRNMVASDANLVKLQTAAAILT